MGLGVLPFLLFVAFVVFRVVKEAAKVDEGRPGSGDPLLGPRTGGEGARDISDFLEELKRVHSPSPPLVESYNETRELRQRVRDASRQNREMKTRILETQPPAVCVPAALPLQAEKEEDFYSVSAEAAYSERGVVRASGGLAHPVFAGIPNDQMTMGKRAIVLREVLGPPLGLR